MGLRLGVAGEMLQRIEDVAATHLLEAPQEGAGVIEHDPGTAAFADQLRNQIRHPAVALRKGFGVVVVALARVIKHVLQMIDQLTLRACRDGGLMHVQCAGKAGANPFQALGVPAWRQFAVHLLPNLVGPMVVYATLAVPAAILSESSLSFLGIGVREPVPSWGNLASAGLAGSVGDSLLRAGLQSKRWCEPCRTWTERRVHTCKYRTQHARGLRWMTNDTVNFLATAIGALVALAVLGSLD